MRTIDHSHDAIQLIVKDALFLQRSGLSRPAHAYMSALDKLLERDFGETAAEAYNAPEGFETWCIKNLNMKAGDFTYPEKRRPR